MPPGTRRLRVGIDPAWLAGALSRDPVLHAYAAWDIERAPGSTRFVTWGDDGPSRSYLLIWEGDPNAPVVHWVGDEPDDLPLAGEVPDDVAVAVVPERAVAALRARFPVANVEPVLTMVRPPDRPPPEGTRAPARRLSVRHSEELRQFVDRHPDMLTRPFRTLDLEFEPVWGSFEGDALAGIARATVRLPTVWILSGVFVAPEARGRGHGSAVARAMVATAREAGAATGLFVREPNAVARGLYERLGFQRRVRRFWVDIARPGPAGAPPR
jgi:GNAT superfamily N-acetyltransferase